jgi:hypothetical protein
MNWNDLSIVNPRSQFIREQRTSQSPNSLLIPDLVGVVRFRLYFLTEGGYSKSKSISTSLVDPEKLKSENVLEVSRIVGIWFKN